MANSFVDRHSPAMAKALTLSSLPAELDAVVLGSLSSIELLRSARTSARFRRAVGEILRAREASVPQQEWRAAAAPRFQVVTREDSSETRMMLRRASCKTRAQLRDDVLRPAMRTALDGWQRVPDLAVVHYTEACRVARSGTSQHHTFTQELAADAASMLPPSTTVLVVRATGILGSGLISRCKDASRDDAKRATRPSYSVNQWNRLWKRRVPSDASISLVSPAHEEEEEEPALIVQLARLPGVSLSWLAIGSSCCERNETLNRERWRQEDLTYHGRERRLAGEWWAAAEGGTAEGACRAPPFRTPAEYALAGPDLLGEAGFEDLPHPSAAVDLMAPAPLGPQIIQKLMDRWAPGRGRDDGPRVLAFVTPEWDEHANACVEGTKLAAGGIAVSTGFKPPGPLDVSPTKSKRAVHDPEDVSGLEPDPGPQPDRDTWGVPRQLRRAVETAGEVTTTPCDVTAGEVTTTPCDVTAALTTPRNHPV